MKKSCIVICGPTAVGKTSVAIRLALHLNTQIISADSRQCFRELSIGVAKPGYAELQSVHHYFINSHSINDEMNAGIFENYALRSVEEIFKEHNVAVMVGGTGLYIKAFCEGMDDIPEIDPATRKEITAGYISHGLTWLQQQLSIQDPGYFENAEQQNPQRLMRALEVKMSSGRSISSFQRLQKKQRDFDIIKIALELPRTVLYDNINRRVDEMLVQGLVEEVKGLLACKQLNALQTVGYKEIFDHLNGNISLERAVELIKQNSRHYAKRQLTWFKKDPDIKWFTPGVALEDIEKLILAGH